ncbi:MAG: STAS domain-containing protein [Desulfuromonadales bacterium]|nr:STAS domain-containing protein [Desulfuromonadales bacterium]
MKMHEVEAGEMVTLQWSGDLTIRRIAELKGQIEEALATATHISIEIGADAESDMTVLQLLCAAHRTAARQEKSLQLCGKIPEQFRSVMNLAGFSRHIGCARDKAGCCLWKLVYHQLDEQSSARSAATN